MFSWFVWKACNKAVFENKPFDAYIVIHCGVRSIRNLNTLKAISDSSKPSSLSHSPNLRSKWSLTLFDFAKVNYNGVFNCFNQTSRIGVIIKDSFGLFIIAHSKSRFSITPPMAECHGAKWGLFWLVILIFIEFLEEDASNVSKWLNGSLDYWTCNVRPILYDCINFQSYFDEIYLLK